VHISFWRYIIIIILKHKVKIIEQENILIKSEEEENIENKECSFASLTKLNDDKLYSITYNMDDDPAILVSTMLEYMESQIAYKNLKLPSIFKTNTNNYG
jgi:hypothetical protein